MVLEAKSILSLDCKILILLTYSSGEDWQPLLIYRNSLVHGEGEMPPIPSKRPYTRKRRMGDDDDDDDDDMDD